MNICLILNGYRDELNLQI